MPNPTQVFLVTILLLLLGRSIAQEPGNVLEDALEDMNDLLENDMEDFKMAMIKVPQTKMINDVSTDVTGLTSRVSELNWPNSSIAYTIFPSGKVSNII